jgi:hypothetical protein
MRDHSGSMRFKLWEFVLSGKKLDDLDTNYELNNAHISQMMERDFPKH